jgi:hypothetical protein
VVVLTNLDETPLPDVIAFNAIDRLLGLAQVPWTKRYLDEEVGSKQAEEKARGKGYEIRKPGTHPSHDMKEYAGEYENPGYGIVAISEEPAGLVVKLNKLTMHMQHFHYDVFEVPYDPQNPFSQQKLQFSSDLNGDIASLAMPLEPHVKDIVFTRMPDRQLVDRVFVAAFVGQYATPGEPVPFAVILRGDHTLYLTRPGSPDRELLPKRGTSFDLAGLAGHSIEFKRDPSGKTTEAVLHTPDAATVLERR